MPPGNYSKLPRLIAEDDSHGLRNWCRKLRDHFRIEYMSSGRNLAGTPLWRGGIHVGILGA